MLNNALAYLIDVFFALFTYAILLRFVMQAMRAPFRNPLGQAVMALTDRVVVFNHGQLLAEGVASDVMQRPDVMTAYLGRAHA